MRGVFYVGGVALGLFLAGCQTGNRSPGGGGGIPPPAPAPFATSDTGTPAALTGNVGGRSGGAGSAGAEASNVLAGWVQDPSGRPRPKTRIEIQPANEIGKSSRAPSTLETGEDGSFVVQGLKPGVMYSLRSTIDMAGKRYTGEVQAAPPMPNMVIRLMPETSSPVAGITPPSASDKMSPSIDPSVTPRTGEIPALPAIPGSASNIAGSGAAVVRPGVPVTVPGPGAMGPSSSAPTIRPKFAAEIVPVSLMEGSRVDRLELPDLEGGSWSLERDRKGKLVLLDFWGTWCGPCMRALPEMIALKRAYGPHGLEVVGIACENDQDRRVQRVREVRDHHKIDYRLLLGGPPSASGGDAVQKDFRIQQYPTLVLLDEEGNQIWRGSPNDLAGLQRVIRARLNLR